MIQAGCVLSRSDVVLCQLCCGLSGCNCSQQLALSACFAKHWGWRERSCVRALCCAMLCNRCPVSVPRALVWLAVPLTAAAQPGFVVQRAAQHVQDVELRLVGLCPLGGHGLERVCGVCAVYLQARGQLNPPCVSTLFGQTDSMGGWCLHYRLFDRRCFATAGCALSE